MMKLRKTLSVLMIISGLFTSALCIHTYNSEHRELQLGAEYYVSIQEAAMETPLAELPDILLNEPDIIVTDSEPEEPEWVPYVDFEAMREIAPDIVAWIRCGDTIIDYPVVQTNDNAYYLKHLPDATENAAGSIFLDYRNTSDFSDKSSILYGHHMKNGEMFASLKHYKEQAYYDAHGVIELHTENGDFIIQLFAGYVVDAQTETVPRKFEDDAAFLSHIEQIRSRSTFESEVEVTATDRLVSLCTCIYDFEDARYILTGKIVQINRN